jgi:hypothetical protein
VNQRIVATILKYIVFVLNNAHFTLHLFVQLLHYYKQQSCAAFEVSPIRALLLLTIVYGTHRSLALGTPTTYRSSKYDYRSSHILHAFSQYLKDNAGTEHCSA